MRMGSECVCLELGGVSAGLEGGKQIMKTSPQIGSMGESSFHEGLLMRITDGVGRVLGH